VLLCEVLLQPLCAFLFRFAEKMPLCENFGSLGMLIRGGTNTLLKRHVR
jgi:hypothetical protein